MDRVKTGQIKLGILVLAFFLLMTGAFVGMLLRLEYVMTQTDAEEKVFYILMDSDYEDIVAHDGTIAFRTEQAVQEGIYRRQTLQAVRSALLPLSLVFLAVCLFMSFVLWLLLRKIRDRDLTQIAAQLASMTKADLAVDNPALSAAYTAIRQRLEDNLNDYQRLNSYLSHEQKNALAILRTELEASGQIECLHLIDAMNDGINDVLTLSENLDTAAPATVDVALVCAEVCDDYRHLSDQITFTFDEDDNTEIEGRQRWIYRAVANLLDNAIKYGGGNPIHVSVCAQKGSVIVRVADHGIGISPEKQEKIFSHRYRIDELNKDGYGIGLSLVSHVCDLCGGFVTVESEVGNGSAFYLSFPQKQL